MKTFKQFMEQQKNDVPDIIKNLQGIAQNASKTINPEKVKKGVIDTVITKLGDKVGSEKIMDKIQTTTDKMSKEMPGKFKEFDKFLKSGVIEKGFSKLSDQLKKQTK